MLTYYLWIRFSVAIKSTRSLSPNTKADVRGNNYDSDSKDNADVDLLIDEAKTMLSIGAYHENIVNLQGIGYEIDQNNKCISQVRISGVYSEYHWFITK